MYWNPLRLSKLLQSSSAAWGGPSKAVWDFLRVKSWAELKKWRSWRMIVAVIMRLACVCVGEKLLLTESKSPESGPWWRSLTDVFSFWIKTDKVSACVKSRTGVHGELTCRAVSGDLCWGKSMWDVHCLKVSCEAGHSSDDNSPSRKPLPDWLFSYITSVFSVFLEDISSHALAGELCGVAVCVFTFRVQ